MNLAAHSRLTFGQDDFGNDAPALLSEPFFTTSVNAAIRFMIDGCVEGIAEGILDGTCDDQSLAFFGLI